MRPPKTDSDVETQIRRLVEKNLSIRDRSNRVMMAIARWGDNYWLPGKWYDDSTGGQIDPHKLRVWADRDRVKVKKQQKGNTKSASLYLYRTVHEACEGMPLVQARLNKSIQTLRDKIREAK